MEFDGDGVYALNIEERMTLCNMVIEAGGKNGVIAPDQVTLDYVNARNPATSRTPPVYTDTGARFIYEKVYDVTKMEPVVAKPHSPDNRATVSEVQRHPAGPGLHRLLHRRQDDRLPRGGGHPEGPHGQDRHLRGAGDQRDRRGTEDRRNSNGQTLEEVFLAAGAKIGPPSCAACLGGPSDTFGRLNSR